MEDKVEKSKDKKKQVILVLLLILLLLGIWKCPGQFSDSSADEIQEEKDHSQLVLCQDEIDG